MTATIHNAIVGRQQERSPTASYGLVSIEATHLAILRHLDAAIDQASGRVAGLGAMRPLAGTDQLKGEHLKAVKVVNWLGSREAGPVQLLEILRAAGRQTILLPRLDGKTDLERVLAIGKALEQALKALTPQELARAREAVSRRDRNR